MAQSIKGKKGFQSINPKDKRTKRGVYYLTELEHKKLKEYCIKNDTTPSIFVRELLNDIIKD